MEISLAKNTSASDLSLIPLFKEEGLSTRLKSYFDQQTLLLIAADFKNECNETHLAYSPNLGRVMLLGLGPKKQLTLGSFRKSIQTAINSVRSLRLDTLQIILPALPGSQFLEMLAFGLVFGNYIFDYYKKDKQKSQIKKAVIITKQVSEKNQQAIKRGRIIALAVNQSRDLANHPANVATPKHLAKHALEIAKKHKIKIKILDEKTIKKESLGLLLGVSAGSDEPPRLIVMDLGPANQDPIVLIGKGLTFDSGGVSIKPADKMDEMKFDMCGAATVLGIMEAASQLKLKQRLVAVIPSSENLISGRAVKPGDVLRSHNGQTVEVINTDAEGRLILADAISYAKKYYQPKAIIDYATLTGAVIVALGDEYTGAMTNTEKFNNALTYASETTGEKIAFLPLAPEYKDQLRSNIADLKNVGDKGFAGAITAALFLEKFVGPTPWIHLDTAGTAWTMRKRPHIPAGATGWGVYFTLAQLFKLR